jgi:hypothetical protein
MMMEQITGRPEPVLDAAALVAIVAAIIALAVAAGVPISDELKMAIIGVVGVLAPFVVPWLSRSKVTPVDDPKGTNTRGQVVELVPADGSTLAGKASG